MRIRGESLHCVIKMACWQVVSFVCVGELLELGEGGGFHTPGCIPCELLA